MLLNLNIDILSDKCLTTSLRYQSFVSAVHEHFGDIVLARNWVHMYLQLFSLSVFSYYFTASVANKA